MSLFSVHRCRCSRLYCSLHLRAPPSSCAVFNLRSRLKVVKITTSSSEIIRGGGGGLFKSRSLRLFSKRSLGQFSTLKASKSDESPSAASTADDDIEAFAAKAQGGRLWSNVNAVSMKHEPGSLFGSACLVAGTTVGAGILALPNATVDAGFVPSAVTILLCWAFMAGTGLLVAEVNLQTSCELGSGGVSIMTMAKRTLGNTGSNVSSAAYIFLHYCLLVAYISRGGEGMAGLLGAPKDSLMYTVGGPLTYTVPLCVLCYAPPQRILEGVNSALVAGVVISFGSILAYNVPNVDVAALLHAPVPPVRGSEPLDAAIGSIPVVALAFVYHNVIPVCVTNLEGDVRNIRKAIIYGSGAPLAMFLLWNAAVLGQVPALQTLGYLGGAGEVTDPVAALESYVASTGTGVIALASSSFAFFAVATSFIGFVLGLSDFFTDFVASSTLSSQKNAKDGSSSSSTDRRGALPILLTVVPPFILATSGGKEIFFSALDYAGTFGVMVLFGVLPPIMAWRARYADNVLLATRPLLPGGQPALVGLGAFAALVILRDTYVRVAGG